MDAGYSVRDTSRSLTSSRNLEEVLKDCVDAGRFSVVEIKDVTANGAFDEAIKGIQNLPN